MAAEVIAVAQLNAASKQGIGAQLNAGRSHQDVDSLIGAVKLLDAGLYQVKRGLGAAKIVLVVRLVSVWQSGSKGFILNQGCDKGSNSDLLVPILDRIAAGWTNVGTKWGVFPASVLIGIGFLYARRWRFLTYWLIALLGCVLINRVAKLWLHRVRPSLWDYPPVPEFSFPSGHAMASMGFVAALIVLTWNTSWRIWVWLLGGGFVVSIAWTRLYLGVHYPSDIVAGWLLSIAWAVGVCLIVKPLSSTAISRSALALSDRGGRNQEAGGGGE
ncbi:phosphatase PAP2 family protein [Leptolyngbya sp. 7M]|uniref:phosphatase PAP2 family protein n=1 Tax=Leptolyngbya sp. 7M TaxID=2812896 RepID=UPI002938DC85|nr:phosphatase PAP2 family protein [Leptolyngbya sp. 7M]